MTHSTGKKSKKHKHKRRSENDKIVEETAETFEQNEISQPSVSVTSPPSKQDHKGSDSDAFNRKKKKKRKHGSAEVMEDILEEETVKKRKRKEFQVEMDDEEFVKKKKKKIRSHLSFGHNSQDDNEEDTVETSSRKRKKDKSAKRKSTLCDNGDSHSKHGHAQSLDVEVVKKKRKKHKRERVHNDCNVDVTENTKHIEKKESRLPDFDVNTSSQRKKKKKKKQKMEAADSPNRHYLPKEDERLGEDTTKADTGMAGQWATAAFENDERKQKFLRLLGGFRKSSADSVEKSTVKTGGFAMDTNAQNSYIQAMENQFTNALSQNCNRGIGLGYKTPLGAGKKFYIDRNKSNSMKFEDSD